MSSLQITYGLVKGLHDFFTVLWLGGLFTLALVVLPVLQKNLEKGPALKNLVAAIQARMRKFIFVSIAGLLLTGIYLTRMQTGTPAPAFLLPLKLVFFVLMGVIIVVRGKLLQKPQENLQPAIKLLILLNMALGLGILLISGLLSG